MIAMWNTALALVLALGAGAVAAQDEKTPPGDDEKYRPEDEREKPDDDLTPEQAMAMLKEIQGLMGKSEELLNDSSRGKALETEEDLLKRLSELLKDDETAQKQILVMIKRLMEKTQKHQQESVQKLGDIIRRAKSQQGKGQGKPQPGQQKPQGQQQAQKPQQPGSPATAPYDPNRTGDPVNKFRSQADRTQRWGDLPARVREAILSGKRDIDDYPAEYRGALEDFTKRLIEEKE